MTLFVFHTGLLFSSDLVLSVFEGPLVLATTGVSRSYLRLEGGGEVVQLEGEFREAVELIDVLLVRPFLPESCCLLYIGQNQTFRPLPFDLGHLLSSFFNFHFNLVM
jgi:hypothetical protein